MSLLRRETKPSSRVKMPATAASLRATSDEIQSMGGAPSLLTSLLVRFAPRPLARYWEARLTSTALYGSWVTTGRLRWEWCRQAARWGLRWVLFLSLIKLPVSINFKAGDAA